ncbi:FAD-dependent oxidoreductase [Natronomonas salsuginis]|jgi:cytochrome-b5 reductase|uniref:FAD-dependent oxidoreductase n=1 Tax=Natronomonas salsuginis TaxID=2217661 RepID=A0A4U5J9D0_9EURY|nr:FAD-dependent oxidoreductase [Natronomonas salsuginis]TKR24831.1 FAD-dependent oxidoreductase [Natronomonas salsuginis]
MDSIETTVTAIHDVGTNAVAIEITTPPGFSAVPGQFVKLSATIDDETVARFYTVSSRDTRNTFELTVSYDPEEGGEFSEYLLSLSSGDSITITGPFGDDYYEGEPRVVVLAGGPGIGPAVAIAERALADGHEAAVVYRDDDPIHEDRLATLAAGGADVFVLADETDLTDAVADVLTNDDGEQVFIYGFADFLGDAEAAIEAAGGDPDAAKAENFG